MTALDNYFTGQYTPSTSNSVAPLCNAVKITAFSDSGHTTQLLQGTLFSQAGGSATDNVDTALDIALVTTASTQSTIYIKATIRSGSATSAFSINKDMTFVICNNEALDASQPPGD